MYPHISYFIFQKWWYSVFQKFDDHIISNRKHTPPFFLTIQYLMKWGEKRTSIDQGENHTFSFTPSKIAHIYFSSCFSFSSFRAFFSCPKKMKKESEESCVLTRKKFTFRPHTGIPYAGNLTTELSSFSFFL